MQLLISDTNILIDMEEGKLLTLFFDLPFTFCVPDILYFEELEAQHAHLMDMGLSLKELTAESLLEAQTVMQRHSGPSRRNVHSFPVIMTCVPPPRLNRWKLEELFG